MARRGVSSCVFSLFFLSLLPYFTEQDATVQTGIRVMYLAAALLAFTSATVVNSLTALASLQCDEDNGKEKEKATAHPRLSKGRALGRFRSSGQLGRAVGPLLGESPLSPNFGSLMTSSFEQHAPLIGLSASHQCTFLLAMVSNTFVYFAGPTVTYIVGGGAMFILTRHMRQIQGGESKLSGMKKVLSNPTPTCIFGT